MENHLEYAYWLATLFSFCEVTDMLFTVRVLYHSPVTTIPHRWKCGFEDHWTLNLPRYITITETPVPSNFVLSHYENSVFNCPPHFSFLMTICSAPEYEKQVFRTQQFPNFCYWEIWRIFIRHSSVFLWYKTYSWLRLNLGLRVPRHEKEGSQLFAS